MTVANVKIIVEILAESMRFIEVDQKENYQNFLKCDLISRHDSGTVVYKFLITIL